MKTITILTSQNVPIEYDLAAVRDRLLAALLDVVAVFISYIIFVFIVLRDSNFLNDRFGEVFVVYFSFVVFVLYQILCEMFLGGTLGKKALNIKTIRLDGQELTLGDHVVRSVFYLIDCFITSGFLAIVMVMSTDFSQRLGDMATNTTVIKLRKQYNFSLANILSISSLDNYEPVYPQVANLREEDLILVKIMLNRHRKYNNDAHTDAIHQCAQRLQQILEIPYYQGDVYSFLNTILKDYIVLTR
jgi:uncharacterized RDD family membrane protein YckC